MFRVLNIILSVLLAMYFALWTSVAFAQGSDAVAGVDRSSSAQVNNQTQISWLVRFNNAVSNIDADGTDFELRLNGATTPFADADLQVSLFPTTTSNYTVRVLGTSRLLEGSYTLHFSSANDITPSIGVLPADLPTSAANTVRLLPLTIASISRTDNTLNYPPSAPTSVRSNTLQWDITFNRPPLLSSFSPTDFQTTEQDITDTLESTSSFATTSDANVIRATTTLTGTDSDYQGAVRFRLSPSGVTATDIAGNALAPSLIASPPIDRDTIPPTVDTVTIAGGRNLITLSASRISWQLEFNEYVEGLDAGDIEIYDPAGIFPDTLETSTITSSPNDTWVIAPVSFSTFTTTVARSTISIRLARASGASGHNVRDIAGNEWRKTANQDPLQSGLSPTFTLDTEAPTATITAPTVNSLGYVNDYTDLSWRFEFSDDIDTSSVVGTEFDLHRNGVSLGNTVIFAIDTPDSTQPHIKTISVDSTSTTTFADGTYTIELNSSFGGAGITDTVGNVYSAIVGAPSIILDATNPQHTRAIATTGNSENDLSWDITFDELIRVSTLTESDLSITPVTEGGIAPIGVSAPFLSLALTGASITITPLNHSDGTTYDSTATIPLTDRFRVAISGITHSTFKRSFLELSIPAASVQDRGGNDNELNAPTGTDREVIYHDITTPSILPNSLVATITARQVAFVLTFTEPVRGVESALGSGIGSGISITASPTTPTPTRTIVGSIPHSNNPNLAAADRLFTQWTITTTTSGFDPQTLTLALDVSAASSIVGYGGSALSASSSDQTASASLERPPVIDTVVRTLNENIIGTGTLSWTINFSKPVLGVDTGDFEAFAGTTTFAALINPDTPTVATQSYTITALASSFTHADNVGLRIARDSHNILDSLSNPFARDTSTSPTLTTAGTNTYIIDSQPPTIISVGRGTDSTGRAIGNRDPTLIWEVDFSEQVVLSSLTNQFRLSDSQTSSTSRNTIPANFTITQATGNPRAGGIYRYIIEVVPTDVNYQGDTYLSIIPSATIADNVGNQVINTAAGRNDTAFNNNIITRDTIADVVTGVVVNGSALVSAGSTISWDITFEGIVEGVDGADFEAYHVTTGTPAFTAFALSDAIIQNSGTSPRAGFGLVWRVTGTLPSTITTTTNNIDVGIRVARPAGIDTGDHNIRDSITNVWLRTTGEDPLPSGGSATITVDAVAPRLVSIVPSDPGDFREITWTATFSESVSLPTTGNFSFTDTAGFTTTINGGTITASGTSGVNNTNDTYTFTTTTTGIDATIVTITFDNTPAITDSVSNALTDLAASNTSAHNPDQALIQQDFTPPAIATPDGVVRVGTGFERSDTDNLVWTIAFTEPVDNAQPVDFQAFSSTGGRTALATSATTTDNETYTITVPATNFQDGDIVNLRVVASHGIVDRARPALLPFASNAQTILFDDAAARFTIDAVHPAISSITRGNRGTATGTTPNTGDPIGTRSNLLRWDIEFSEDMDIASVRPDDFTTNNSSTGTVISSTLTVRSLSATQFEITADISGTSSQVGIVLRVAPTSTLSDPVGNNLDDRAAANASLGAVAITRDTIAPTITSLSEASSSTLSINAWTISFPSTESIDTTTISVSDFTINTTADGTGTTLTGTLATPSITATEVTVTATSILNSGNVYTGSVYLRLTTDGIIDEAGNSLDVSLVPASSPITYDITPPTITSIAPAPSVPATPTPGDRDITWRIEFSESVVQPNRADFAVAGTDGIVTTISSGTDLTEPAGFNGGDIWELTTTTPDSSIDTDITLSLASSPTIVDSNGLSLVQPSFSSSSLTIPENDPPSIMLITGTPDHVARTIVWQIMFDEPVSNVDASSFVSLPTGTSITTAPAVSSGVAPQQAWTLTTTTTGEATASITLTEKDADTGGASDGAGNLHEANPTATSQTVTILRDLSSIGFVQQGPDILITISYPSGTDTTGISPIHFQLNDGGGMNVTPTVASAPDSTTNTYVLLAPHGIDDVSETATFGLSPVGESQFLLSSSDFTTTDFVAPHIDSIDVASIDHLTGVITWRATFSEEVSLLDATSFTDTTTTGPITYASFARDTTNTNEWTFTTTSASPSYGLVTLTEQAATVTRGLGSASGARDGVGYGHVPDVVVAQSTPANIMRQLTSATFVQQGSDIIITVAYPTGTDTTGILPSHFELNDGAGSVVTPTVVSAPGTTAYVLTAPHGITATGQTATFGLSTLGETLFLLPDADFTTADFTAPHIDSIAVESVNNVSGEIDWRVTFSEEVSLLDATSFTRTGTSAGVFSYGAFTRDATNTNEWTFTTTSAAPSHGTVTLTERAATVVRGVAASGARDSVGYGHVPDTTAATVSATATIRRELTSVDFVQQGANIRITITYPTGTITNDFDPSQFQLNDGANVVITPTLVSGPDSTTNTYVLEAPHGITATGQTATFGLSSTGADLFVLSDAEFTTTDFTAPDITSIAIDDIDHTAGEITWRVTFTEAVSLLDATSFIADGNTGTVTYGSFTRDTTNTNQWTFTTTSASPSYGTVTLTEQAAVFSRGAGSDSGAGDSVGYGHTPDGAATVSATATILRGLTAATFTQQGANIVITITYPAGTITTGIDPSHFELNDGGSNPVTPTLVSGPDSTSNTYVLTAPHGITADGQTATFGLSTLGATLFSLPSADFTTTDYTAPDITSIVAESVDNVTGIIEWRVTFTEEVSLLDQTSFTNIGSTSTGALTYGSFTRDTTNTDQWTFTTTSASPSHGSVILTEQAATFVRRSGSDSGAGDSVGYGHTPDGTATASSPAIIRRILDTVTAQQNGENLDITITYTNATIQGDIAATDFTASVAGGSALTPTILTAATATQVVLRFAHSATTAGDDLTLSLTTDGQDRFTFASGTNLVFDIISIEAPTISSLTVVDSAPSDIPSRPARTPTFWTVEFSELVANLDSSSFTVAGTAQNIVLDSFTATTPDAAGFATQWTFTATADSVTGSNLGTIILTEKDADTGGANNRGNYRHAAPSSNAATTTATLRAPGSDNPYIESVERTDSTGASTIADSGTNGGVVYWKVVFGDRTDSPAVVHSTVGSDDFRVVYTSTQVANAEATNLTVTSLTDGEEYLISATLPTQDLCCTSDHTAMVRLQLTSASSDIVDDTNTANGLRASVDDDNIVHASGFDGGAAPTAGQPYELTTQPTPAMVTSVIRSDDTGAATTDTSASDGETIYYKVTFDQEVDGVDTGDFLTYHYVDVAAGTFTELGTTTLHSGSDGDTEFVFQVVLPDDGYSATPAASIGLLVARDTSIVSSIDTSVAYGVTTAESLLRTNDTDNQTYAFQTAIDPPTVTSVIRTGAAERDVNPGMVSWTVTFSEPVTGVGASDFAVSNGTARAPVTITVDPDTSILNATPEDTYTVTTNLTNSPPSNPVELNLVATSDSLGIVDIDTAPSPFVSTGDGVLVAGSEPYRLLPAVDLSFVGSHDNLYVRFIATFTPAIPPLSDVSRFAVSDGTTDISHLSFDTAHANHDPIGGVYVIFAPHNVSHSTSAGNFTPSFVSDPMISAMSMVTGENILRVLPVGTGTISGSIFNVEPINTPAAQLMGISTQVAPTGANNREATFRVEFDQAVRNVTSANFSVALMPAGLQGETVSIASVAAVDTSVQQIVGDTNMYYTQWDITASPIDISYTAPTGGVRITYSSITGIDPIGSATSVDSTIPTSGVQTHFESVPDETRPFIVSITRPVQPARDTGDRRVIWRVEFSEPVSDVSADSFASLPSGTTFASVGSAPTALWDITATYTVDGSTALTEANIDGSGDRTTTGGTAEDQTGNRHATNPVAAATATTTVDSVAPTIMSIVRTASAERDVVGGVIEWTVQFSENVTGVDTGDFAASDGTDHDVGTTVVAAGADARTYSVTTTLPNFSASTTDIATLSLVSTSASLGIQDTSLAPIRFVSTADTNLMTITDDNTYRWLPVISVGFVGSHDHLYVRFITTISPPVAVLTDSSRFSIQRSGSDIAHLEFDINHTSHNPTGGVYVVRAPHDLHNGSASASMFTPRFASTPMLSAAAPVSGENVARVLSTTSDPIEGSPFAVDPVSIPAAQLMGISTQVVPTSANRAVTFRAEFTQAVRGVTDANFSVELLPAGLQGETVTIASVVAVDSSLEQIAGDTNMYYTQWDITTTAVAGTYTDPNGAIHITYDSTSNIIPIGSATSVDSTIPTSGIETHMERIVDETRPFITAIERPTQPPRTTGDRQVIWSVTFSEPVNGVVADSFDSIPSGATFVPVGAAPSAMWTVTATYPSDGSVTLTEATTTGADSTNLMTAGATATDASGNRHGTNPSGAITATTIVDSTAPTVTSVIRSTATGERDVTGGVIVWTVEFSEPVVGVDPSDFAAFDGTNRVGSTTITPNTSGLNATAASTYTVTTTLPDFSASTTDVATINLVATGDSATLDIQDEGIAPILFSSGADTNLMATGQEPYHWLPVISVTFGSPTSGGHDYLDILFVVTVSPPVNSSAFPIGLFTVAKDGVAIPSADLRYLDASAGRLLAHPMHDPANGSYVISAPHGVNHQSASSSDFVLTLTPRTTILAAMNETGENIQRVIPAMAQSGSPRTLAPGDVNAAQIDSLTVPVAPVSMERHVIYRAVFDQDVAGVTATNFTATLDPASTASPVLTATVGTPSPVSSMSIGGTNFASVWDIRVNVPRAYITANRADASVTLTYSNSTGISSRNGATTIATPPTSPAIERNQRFVDEERPFIITGGITRPTVAPMTTGSRLVTWRVEFSEPVSGVDADSFASLPAGVRIGTPVAAPGQTAPTELWDVPVTYATDGTATLTEATFPTATDMNRGTIGATAMDTSGNLHNVNPAGAATATTMVDSVAPTVAGVTITSPTPTSSAPNVDVIGDTIIWEVTFSEAVLGVDSSDFIVFDGSDPVGTTTVTPDTSAMNAVATDTYTVTTVLADTSPFPDVAALNLVASGDAASLAIHDVGPAPILFAATQNVNLTRTPTQPVVRWLPRIAVSTDDLDHDEYNEFFVLNFTPPITQAQFNTIALTATTGGNTAVATFEDAHPRNNATNGIYVVSVPHGVLASAASGREVILTLTPASQITAATLPAETRGRVLPTTSIMETQNVASVEAPMVSSITSTVAADPMGSIVTFTVTFDQLVRGVASSNFDVELNGGTVMSGETISIDTVVAADSTPVTIGGDTHSFVWTITTTRAPTAYEMRESGTGGVQLELSTRTGIESRGGSVVAAPSAPADHRQRQQLEDRDPPLVVSITPAAATSRTRQVMWTITFNELVTGVSSNVVSASPNNIIFGNGGDFTPMNPIAATITLAGGGTSDVMLATTWTFSTTSSSDGDLTLTERVSSAILDRGVPTANAHAAINNPAVSGTVSIDTSVPTPTFTLLDTSPTTALPLRWRVSFNEPIDSNSISAADFQLLNAAGNSAVTGSRISVAITPDATASASAPAWTVQVNDSTDLSPSSTEIPQIGGQQNYTLSIIGSDTDGIADLAGNRIESDIISPASYRYNAPDRTPPRLVSLAGAVTNRARVESAIRWTVTFDEPVTGVEASDFMITASSTFTAGSPTLTPTLVSPSTSSSQSRTWTIGVSGIPAGDQFTDITLTLAIMNGLSASGSGITDVVMSPAMPNEIRDLTPVDTTADSTVIYNTDAAPPTLATMDSITFSGSVFTITFSEPVMGMDTTTPANMNFVLSGGDPSLVISAVAPTNTMTIGTATFSDTWQVTTSDAGAVTLTFVPTDSVVDRGGNAVVGGGSLLRTVSVSGTPTSVIYGNVASVVNSAVEVNPEDIDGTPDVNRPAGRTGLTMATAAGNVSAVTWTVNYIASVPAASASNYVVQCSPSTACRGRLSIAVDTMSSTTHAVTVTGIESNPTVATYTLMGNADFNLNSFTSTTAVLYVDNDGPSVVTFEQVIPVPNPPTWRLVFDEPVDGSRMGRTNFMLNNIIYAGTALANPNTGFATEFMIQFIPELTANAPISVIPSNDGTWDMAGNLVSGVNSTTVIEQVTAVIAERVESSARTFIDSTPSIVSRLNRLSQRATTGGGSRGAILDDRDTQNFTASVTNGTKDIKYDGKFFAGDTSVHSFATAMTNSTLDIDYSGVIALHETYRSNKRPITKQRSRKTKRSSKAPRSDRHTTTSNEALGTELWFQASYSSSTNSMTDVEDIITFFNLGLDVGLDDSTVVGLMYQLDMTNSLRPADMMDPNSVASMIDGEGWLLSPYFAKRLYSGLTIEARAGFGKLKDSITFDRASGMVTDMVISDRIAASVGISGDGVRGLGGWIIHPSFGYNYYSVKTDSYMDSNNVVNPAREFTLHSLEFGPRLSKTYNATNGSSFVPTFIFSGLYDMTKNEVAATSSAPATMTQNPASITGKVDMNLNFIGASGFDWNVGGYYSGIGSPTNSFGFTGGVKVNF